MNTLSHEQDNLYKILGSVRAGNCCRVLGPRFRGKSRLMRQAAATLRESGAHHTSYQSLAKVSQVDEQNFFAALYARIEQDFFVQEQDHPTSAFEFQRTLIQLVRSSDRNLALFVDDLEIAPPNSVAALLGALRAVFTTVIDQPGARFQAVVCGSLNLNQVALDSASRFESISDLVLIDDLDERERLALANDLCRQAGLTPTDKGVQALLEQTGGDSFLIEHVSRICFEQMARVGRVKMTPARVAEAVETLLQRSPDWKVVEVLKQVESNPSLLSCTLLILRRGQVHSAQLPIDTTEMPTALDLCGVFSRRGNHYQVKCKLWSSLLRQHLTAEHVGGLYAVAGQWNEALRYFGQAISAERSAVQSELFAATLNAMHASDNVLQAFGYLAQGLQAAHPESEFYLYYARGEALDLIHPFEGSRERRQIPLDDLRFPEAAALSGPEYSIASTAQDSRLLIPLRTARAHTIGLASFSKLIPQDSPYRQREEILQLVGFLRQAAQAIETKGQFTTLLDDAKSRVSKLNTLNSILTYILQRDCSEDVILRLMLLGVTSNWGLEFNRAALFMPHESRQVLIGRYSTGPLDQEKDETAGSALAQPTLDDLIAAVLAGRGQETPLLQKIKQLEIPLDPSLDNLLADSFENCRPVFGSQYWSQTKEWPPALVAAIDPPPGFALVPLSAVNQTLGLLYVDNKFTKRSITEEHFELLQTFASQAALMLENVRALAAEKERTNILTELLKVEDRLNDHITTSVQELLDEIVRSACALIGADCAVLTPLRPGIGQSRFIKQAERYIAYCETNPEIASQDTLSLVEGIVPWGAAQRLVYVSDIEIHDSPPDEQQIDAYTCTPGVRSLVAIRLGPDEELEGILYIYWRSPHLLTQEEQTIIEIFANFAAVAIPSARRHQQVKADLLHRTQELKGLSEVFYASLGFWSEEEIEGAIKHTLQTARKLTDAPQIHLIRNEPHGVWRAFWLTPSGELHSKPKEMHQDGLTFRAFTATASQLVANAGPLGTGKFPDRYHPDSRSGLAVPVQVSRSCLAVLRLESPQPYGLNTFHREFLEHLVSQLAFTLEQAEIYQALRQLVEISPQLTRETNLQQVLVSVVEQAMGAMRAVDAITLYYIEHESKRLMLGHKAGLYDPAAIGHFHEMHSGTVIDQVLTSDDPIFAEKVLENELLRGPFVRREEIRSAAAFPLKVREERVGCMFFNYRFEHVFAHGEKSVLNLFAQWAAFAILRATLSDEAERRRQRLETVARITPIISASLALDDVFRAMLREVKLAVPQAQNACVVELDEETSTLLIAPVGLEFYQVDRPPRQGPYRAGATERTGIAGQVIQSGRPKIVPDVQKDANYIPAISSTRSELCVPITLDGKTQSALVLESDQLNAFTADEQLLLEMLADHAAIAIQNAQQYAKLEAAQAELEQGRERELRGRIADMATGLIHDINSAVATIPDLVAEIQEKSQAGGDIQAPLADLQKSALVTGRISNRLRDFVITGQFKPEFLRLEPLISKAFDTAQNQKSARVTLQCQMNGLNPEIMADGLWIELLVQNLILNALDAIPADQEGLVEIEVEMDADNVYIHVTDNGIGIADKDLSRLFDPGYTTKEDQSRLHGIGLYHCLQVVREHRGDLKVRSAPGAGTVFTAILPRAFSKG